MYLTHNIGNASALPIILIPKTIGNRKRDCAWGCAWGINTTWENMQIEKHKSGRRSFRSPIWFVLFDLQIFSGGVYSPSATSRTISFSISNSFGINLIHFFDFFRRERRTVQPEIRSFALLLRSPVSHAIWQCEECELFRKVQRFWQRKVWPRRSSRGEKLSCNFFGKEKHKTLRQY